MSSPIELSTLHAQACLVQLGLHVERIAVAPPARRADLRATHGEDEYIFEAKERAPHEGWLAMREDARSNVSARVTREVRPWTALTERIREAYEQLVATEGTRDAYRLMWNVAPQGDHSFVLECLEKRLLGTVSVSVFERTDKPMRMLDCYNHAPARFVQSPRMVGAVVSSDRGGRLIVNPFSPDRERFRSSYLYRQFARGNAVTDPELLVANGDALMLGDDFVRDETSRHGHAQWAYLKDRHGLLISKGVESQFDALLVLPADAFERDED